MCWCLEYPALTTSHILWDILPLFGFMRLLQKKEADNHVTSHFVPLWQAPQDALPGFKSRKVHAFSMQTVSTSFCKLPEAALYLSCTVLIICPWTDNCCFPCMFSLSCCHKKWVPPHYSSQQQGLALGHQPLWLPMDFSHFTIFFLLFTDQGHSGLNAEIICISHMGSYLVKVKKNQPKKEKKKQFQCCIL